MWVVSGSWCGPFNGPRISGSCSLRNLVTLSSIVSNKVQLRPPIWTKINLNHSTDAFIVTSHFEEVEVGRFSGLSQSLLAVLPMRFWFAVHFPLLTEISGAGITTSCTRVSGRGVILDLTSKSCKGAGSRSLAGTENSVTFRFIRSKS